MTIPQMSLEAQLKAAHIERRRRFEMAAKTTRKPVDVKPEPVVTYVQEYMTEPNNTDTVCGPPLWKQFQLNFDAHIINYQAWKKEQEPARISVKSYILMRCKELGVDYKIIIGPSRIKRHCKARHLIMWEIKTCFKPEISYPELGRMFGNRDHTSCLWAVSKMQEEMNKKNEDDRDINLPAWYKRKVKKVCCNEQEKNFE